MLSKITNKILKLFVRIYEIFNSIKQIIKKGGFSTFNISYITQGEILKGKRVLITGGSQGIGLAIAKKFISEGALVLVTGRDQSTLETVCKKLNSTYVKYLTWDVSNLNELNLNLDKAENLLNGKIDILVNNAGIVNNDQKFPLISEETWDSVYAVNSKAVFFLSQEVCKIWQSEKKRNIKKIINLSSQGGYVGAVYPYRMTKWDVAGFTQGLGKLMAKHGIIINGIAPGIVATRLQQNYSTKDKNNFSNENPIERYALPEEIAELALFLASDGAAHFRGQCLSPNGGDVFL